MEKYQGYQNKPTWQVALWILNDEGYQGIIRERRFSSELYDAAQELKQIFTDELYPFDGASIFADLLDIALAYVNWEEVAQAVLFDE